MTGKRTPPTTSVRLDPDLADWVKSHSGRDGLFRDTTHAIHLALSLLREAAEDPAGSEYLARRLRVMLGRK